MNLDVEIYMNGVIKFFNENPKDLQSLIPQDKKDIFFKKIREAALKNCEKGDEVTITQKQMIEICVEINSQPQPIELIHVDGPIYRTKFGEICLN